MLSASLHGFFAGLRASHRFTDLSSVLSPRIASRILRRLAGLTSLHGSLTGSRAPHRFTDLSSVLSPRIASRAPRRPQLTDIPCRRKRHGSRRFVILLYTCFLSSIYSGYVKDMIYDSKGFVKYEERPSALPAKTKNPEKCGNRLLRTRFDLDQSSCIYFVFCSTTIYL